MVHEFTMVMSYYDWVADKSTYNPVRFRTKIVGISLSRGFEMCWCTRRGIGEGEFGSGLGERIVEKKLGRGGFE